MNVLHIASGDLWAGAEVQICTLLKALISSGAKVSVIIFNEGRLADELVQAGANVIVISESQNGIFSLIKKVKIQLARLRPNIVHTHRQKEHIVGSIANMLTSKQPCVRTVHGSPEFSLSFKQRVQSKIDRFCGRNLQHALISVDEELTEKLSTNFRRKHIYTIPNGIDVQDTLFRAETTKINVDDSYKHIGIVGRLEPVKRVDLFLDMAKLIVDSNDEEARYHFHVFGGGNLEAALKHQSHQLNLDETVTFHGHTNAIQSWIKAMDVVVMTSDHEGLPMTSLECLTLGTPLVAHAVGGLVPLLTTAFPQGLVTEHSPHAYAKTTQFIAKAQPLVELPQRYTASRNAQQVLNLYQTLLKD
ncbi:glycosyltransferase [Alteromonas ponticola]|uniref:Glycosyltransferase n=1 Tax=Alteromonas aquimaris TaxID=2998417 RepID=A0ABT3P3C0_9ALTE|nr:glycosyltransferase [Alteromonas aquimaris]MCW8107254.1 glycosyltransferase [Alteromonas aquimaris]